MSDVALEVENLVKVYRPRRQPPVRAVDGMSFSVARGTIFGLLGPNGAGKTTILKILSTLSRPTAGRARLLGFDVVAQPLEVRRRISVVLQETAVELFLSVRDNLLSFARFHGLERGLARRRAADVLERFHLTPDADRKVQDLSGGYRRRVWRRRPRLRCSPSRRLPTPSAASSSRSSALVGTDISTERAEATEKNAAKILGAFSASLRCDSGSWVDATCG